LLVVSRKCHCWWILSRCLPKAQLIIHPIDIEVTNVVRGLNSRKSSNQDKVDLKSRRFHFNPEPFIWLS
jgi:hypothetical protein